MRQNAIKHNSMRFYWNWKSKASPTFPRMQLSPQYINRREKQVAFQQQFLPAFPSRTSSLSWGLHVSAIVRRGGPSGVTTWNQLQLGRAEKWWTSKAVTGNLPHKSRCPPRRAPSARRSLCCCSFVELHPCSQTLRPHNHLTPSWDTVLSAFFSLHLPFPTSHKPMSRPVSFRSSCIHLMMLPSDDHNLFCASPPCLFVLCDLHLFLVFI